MRKSNKGSNPSKKSTSKSQENLSHPKEIHIKGKNSVREAQQIAAPPIKTTPKKK